MQDRTPAPLTIRAFRRRVLKPTEGVFLFHPRVMERLVRLDRGPGLSSLAVPSLSHYLMPRAVFLRGLEDENPDALSVIEGLSLPELVILLPMPSAQELASSDPECLLRNYWGWRFEAEVARTWQIARNDHQDLNLFGGRGLAQWMGEPAFREVRELLEQDQRVVLDLDDDALCRQFVGFVTGLRYFAPGTRGYLFPAIGDWGKLDDWLKDGGLDLPPRHSRHWPQLLVKSRPAGFHGAPDYEPELPMGLPFGRHDPDLADGANTILPLASKWSARGKTGVQQSPEPSVSSQPWSIASRCEEALRQSVTLTHPPDWLTGFGHTLTTFLMPILVRLARGLDRGATADWAVILRLRLFRHSVRAAFRAERAGRYGAALRDLSIAIDQYQQLQGATSLADPVVQRLQTWQRERVETLINNLAVTWRLEPSASRILKMGVRRLLNEPDVAQRSSRPSRLLDDLEQIDREGRTKYYRLQPLVSAWRRKPVQLGLPFQGSLKALRALNAAKTRLDQLPWSGAEVVYFSAPLQVLGERIGQQLQQQLQPRLSQLLDQVGFLPADHAQRVARNLLQEDLFEIIRRRWHLRFADLRDAVARNEAFRLPDSGWRELALGDRLAHFDRQARVALPGVYQPGEFYLKGLQQLSAPLFGSALGRSITRFLLLPLGIAFIGLEALTYLLSLISPNTRELVNVGSVLGVSAGLFIALYTERGRRTVEALRRGGQWLWNDCLYQGWRRFMHWQWMAYWLRQPWVCAVSRYLLEPSLIGALAALPALSVASRLAPDLEGLPGFLLILGFIFGTFLRNSRGGREWLDSLMTGLINFWRQVRHTLAIGLVRWVIDLFDALMHSIEQGLHRVDEAVSHHRGEGRGAMTVKAVIGPVWKLFSDFIHFYAAVLVEPQINPIKHFPVVTVSHKLMLPFLPALTTSLLALLDPVLPQVISLPLVTVTILLLPGLFGFLVWELRANWKLYRANHPDAIQPARFGPAGETLYTLLRRGFHSGALPKAFARLRTVIAQENDQQRNIPQALRRAEARLNRILEAVRTFASQELIFALMDRSQETGHPVTATMDRLEAATALLAVQVALTLQDQPEPGEPLLLEVRFALADEALSGEITLTGPVERFGDLAWLEEETARFLQRAAVGSR
ncbi:MAG: hypothetical protein QG599_698 [Pseudomonadota bacterium]|nr:hypothetical protein [Pseudomonadota bacterium]